MGGGDLNLKKSWHPSTMRNIEKVWKAEQRENEERKRIAELQREIIAERSREDMQRFAENSGVVEKKDNTKLDWMYKGPSGIVDREEYLLGRAVDKTFEQLQQSEQPGKAVSSRKNAVERGDECLPNSIRFAADQQVDLARKMQEDPLLAIKKKEVETRQQLLSNPVKLKQLKQLVEMQTKRKKQKKEKKVKKDKKKRKKKKSSKSRDSDSDTSQAGDESKLDAILAKKLSSLKNAGLLKSLNEHIDDLEEKTKKAHHKREKERGDSDSPEDNRNAKNISSKHERSEPRNIQGNRSRDKIKTERSRSREKFEDRKKGPVTKTENYENRRYSGRPGEEPGRNRRNESPDRRNTGSQKSKNDYDSEDDFKYKRSKYEERRDTGSQNKRNNHDSEDDFKNKRPKYEDRREHCSRRSSSKTPDRGRRHEERSDRDREEKRKISAPDDRIKKSRTHRESDTSDQGDIRSNKKQKEKSDERSKKPTNKHQSSDSSDSDSSSDSSSENESDPKREIHGGSGRRSDSGERRSHLPKFGLMLPDGSKPVPKPTAQVTEEKRLERAPEKPKWTKTERKKLDEKEIEARRREMLENSSWREKERERNIRRHKEELDEENRQQTKFDENFGRKQLAHAVSQTTVEGRIKSNINNIQRSKMAMDRNFARR